MKIKKQPPLYLLLASMSRYRAECLSKTQISFSQWAPHVDETPLEKEAPQDLVQRLALLKAEAGLNALSTTNASATEIKHATEISHILASDQVMVLGDSILGKPHTIENAKQQLQSMSGQTTHFYTSLCVYDIARQEQRTTLDIISVNFRQLNERQIDRYIEMEMPLDCAGSFKSEKAGILLCHSIEGKDPNALVGLPLISLSDSLQHFGYELPI